MKPAPAVLIAALYFAAAVTPQDAPPDGAVEGAVVDSVTGAGIAGASVRLSGPQSARFETTTDGAGRFTIRGIPPGTYFPAADKEGFSLGAAGFARLANAPVHIASGGDPVKVEVTLTPLVTVRGRVFAPDGTPAANVEVGLRPNVFGSVRTDADGRFIFVDIRPGTYTLVANPPENVPPEETAEGTKTAVIATYYPSVADVSLAQPLVLPPPGATGPYEIHLLTAAVHRVSGIVLDEDGNPASDALLSLYAAPQGTPESIPMMIRAGGLSVFVLSVHRASSGTADATATAGADGRFAFPAVPSGDWRINAETDSAPGSQTPAARGTTTFFVGRTDLDGLEIPTAAPFRLSGSIEWQGEWAGQAAAGAYQQSNPLTLIRADDDEFVGSGFVESGHVRFDNVVPGRYRILVHPGLVARLFLGDSEFDETTALSGPFAVTAGGPPLRIVLQRRSGTIRGRVEKGAGATVILLPQRIDGVAFGQSVVCGPDGSFELSAVSPGSYTLAAFEGADSFGPSEILLTAVRGRGTNAKVEEGATTSVTLNVIAAPR